MKSRLLFFAIPAAIVLTACQPATTELTEEHKAAIEDTIQQLNTELTVAMNARDCDSWLLSLSDDIRWGSRTATAPMLTSRVHSDPCWTQLQIQIGVWIGT